MNLCYNIFFLIMLIMLSISTVDCKIVQFVNVLTKNCLANDGKKAVFQTRCDDFNVSWEAEGGTIRNVDNGRCLYSESDGNVLLKKCIGHEGLIRMRLQTIVVIQTGLCFTSDPKSNKVTTAKCNKESNQNWEQLEKKIDSNQLTKP